jgi:hypothetical protein
VLLGSPAFLRHPVAIFSRFAVGPMALGDWIGLREPRLISSQPHRRALAEAAIGTVALLIVLLIPSSASVCGSLSAR